MKTKPVILLAAISALLATGAAAQQDAPPAGAPPTPPGARDGAPPPDRPRDGDAPKPGGPRPDGPRDGARPDGPRGGEGFRPGGREGGGPGGPGPREGGPREGGPGGFGPRGGGPGGPGPQEGVGPSGPRDGANPGPGRPGPFPGGPREGFPQNPVGGPGQFHRGDGPQGSRSEGAPEVRKEKRAYLGIVAVPVSPVLTAQLGLPQGFGLVVEAVAPESPAAKAGLQKYDVLKLLNDQQIVDQGQLATLVKGLGNGKEVSLTLVRKAKEEKVSVTLGEHEVPVGGPEHHGFGGFGGPGRSPGLGERRDNPDPGDRMRNTPERTKEMEEKMREFQKRMHDGRGGPREGFGKPGAALGGGSPEDYAVRGDGFARPGGPVDPERLLREVQPGGAQIRVETQAGSTTINAAQAHLRLKDASGEIEVATEDGKRVLTARDPEGKVIFTGPVNTEEERAAVPEPIRKKLADIHIRQSGTVSSISVGENAAPGRVEASFQEADFQ